MAEHLVKQQLCQCLYESHWAQHRTIRSQPAHTTHFMAQSTFAQRQVQPLKRDNFDQEDDYFVLEGHIYTLGASDYPPLFSVEFFIFHREGNYRL